jgi:hypothetical protein
VKARLHAFCTSCKAWQYGCGTRRSYFAPLPCVNLYLWGTDDRQLHAPASSPHIQWVVPVEQRTVPDATIGNCRQNYPGSSEWMYNVYGGGLTNNINYWRQRLGLLAPHLSQYAFCYRVPRHEVVLQTHRRLAPAAQSVPPAVWRWRHWRHRGPHMQLVSSASTSLQNRWATETRCAVTLTTVAGPQNSRRHSVPSWDVRLSRVVL